MCCRFSPIYILFSRVFFATLAISVSASQAMLTGLFENARFGFFSNLHTCISLLEVYRLGQCLGWRFSPLSKFSSLLSSRAFKDAPHSPFRYGNTNQCLPNFLKMLFLSLPQIYTGVFHLWKSIDLDSGWIFSPISTLFSFVSSRAFPTNVYLFFYRCYF